MNSAATGAKGPKMEELVRAYFLRAGFFVLRGIVLRHAGVDLTDIDVWVYERSATLARRRTIIDVKDRKTPQAAERMFFVKGLAEIVGVEGAGVATSDSRAALRELARKHGVLWIDGSDFQRLKSSQALAGQNRLSEEAFGALVAAVDDVRGNKNFRDGIGFIKSTVADRFGAASANAATECFRTCAEEAVKAHPGSSAAHTITRVSYLAASLVAAGLDFASAETALRPSAERVRQMSDAIRLGADADGALANLRWAEAAIREYLPNGASLAQTVRKKFEDQIKAIPAEGFAEIVVKLTTSDRLFAIAKQLEHAAYAQKFVTFDDLGTDEKGFLGALLDFANVARQRFAEACASPGSASRVSEAHPQSEDDAGVIGRGDAKRDRLL